MRISIRCPFQHGGRPVVARRTFRRQHGDPPAQQRHGLSSRSADESNQTQLLRWMQWHENIVICPGGKAALIPDSRKKPSISTSMALLANDVAQPRAPRSARHRRCWLGVMVCEAWLLLRLLVRFLFWPVSKRFTTDKAAGAPAGDCPCRIFPEDKAWDPTRKLFMP
jgi:hypothetical protein